jgi:opacity protein-like surface antigen
MTVVLATVLISTAIASDAVTEKPRGDYLPRLFVSPTGRMLPSGVVSVAFGGAFASQGGSEWLGLFSVGLGGIAEFEVSTTHLLSNIFNFSEPIGTTSLKFRLLEWQLRDRLVDIALALRSNKWSTISLSESDMSGPAANNPGGGSRGIYNIDFEAHLTSLYLMASTMASPAWSLHVGLVSEEVRTRDLQYDGYGSTPHPPGDFKKTLFMLYGGAEHQINENTHSLFEVGGRSKIEFDTGLQSMTAEVVWYGMGGVRFYVTPVTSFDAGLRYRSDFTGLADTEIRAGLNTGFDILRKFRSMPVR